jgi:hypothetical protein
MLETSRADYLAFLSVLGVELPAQTKLSDAAVQERLKKALDAAQQLSATVSNGSFDPAMHTAWDKAAGPVQPSMSRFSLSEGVTKMSARAQAGDDSEDPLTDLWQTLLALGRAWDTERPATVIQDTEQSSTLLLRVCRPP